MASNNPYSPAGSPWAVDTSGAFADYLQQPQAQPQQSKAQLTGQEGKGTRVAFYLNKFLEGAQKGRYLAQTKELMNERKQDQQINQMLQLAQRLDPAQGEQLTKDIMSEQVKRMTALASQGEKGQKGKGKDGQKQGNPMLGVLKSVGEAVVGGPVNKYDTKELNQKMGQWALALQGGKTREQGGLERQQALDNRIQQMITEKKASSGDPVTVDDIRQDKVAGPVFNQLKSYYPEQETEKRYEQAYPNPYRGKSESEIATMKATSETEAIKAKAVGDIWKQVRLGGAGLPAGVNAKDIQASMFRQEFGLQPSQIKIVTMQEPGTNKYIMAQEVTDRNTGDVKIMDRDGNPVPTGYVPVTRVETRPIKQTTVMVNGKRTIASVDYSDPAKPVVSFPRDAQGNLLTAPAPGNVSEIERTMSLVMGSVKQQMDLANKLVVQKNKALETLRSNDLVYLGADAATKQKMEAAAVADFDKQLKNLGPQLKSNLSLIQSFGGAARNVVRSAIDAGVLNAGDEKSIEDNDVIGNETDDTQNLLDALRKPAGSTAPPK